MSARTSPDFRRLFELTPDPSLILMPDFTISAVNDAYVRAMGVDRDSLLERSILELDSPLEGDLRSSLESALRERVPDLMALQIQSPKDDRGDRFEVRYWRPRNVPILAEDGKVVYLIHRLEDVTDLVRDKKLGAGGSAGREPPVADPLTSAEIDPFFTVSLDMLCISGFDGYFKRVNPAFEAVLGYTAQEFCSSSYLSFIHPDDVEKTRKEVEKQISKGARVLNFENRYRCKDGTYRLLSWKSVPVGSYMYAAARDITESRRAEENLKAARDAAELASRELESFSYSVAHDLRAPLRSMIGFSNILIEDHGASLNDDARTTLGRVTSAAHRMGQLIDGLLSLSRYSRKELVRQEVDLSAMARQIARDLQHTQPDRQVEVSVADGLLAQGDQQLLRAALTNLMSNAWKYTSKLASGARIEVGSRPEDGKTAYFVADNGAGFDMKYADKLFGAFQRLHAASDFEGIGIGLATVQRIVHRHGGRIWAEAAPDKGAVFRFTL